MRFERPLNKVVKPVPPALFASPRQCLLARESRAITEQNNRARVLLNFLYHFHSFNFKDPIYVIYDFMTIDMIGLCSFRSFNDFLIYSLLHNTDYSIRYF